MYPLKISTAVTLPIFAFDTNGDPVTGKTDGNWTKRISKNGGTFAAMTGGDAITITEMENGMYSVPLNSTHTNTAGVLTITLSATGVKQVNLQFRVFSATTDDLVRSVTPANALTVDSSNRAKVDLEQWLGVAPLSLTSQLVQVQGNAHSSAAKAEIATEVSNQLNLAISELTGVPSATPGIRDALMLLYMTVRNNLSATTTLQSIRNDAGTVVAKATLSDDGTTFNRQKLVNGP